MSAPLRVALIGCGGISKSHITGLAEAGDDLAHLCACCDLQEDLASAIATVHPHRPPVYTDHRAMLAQQRPEVVIVATPPNSHVPLSCDCLEAGAHVLCEKPSALSSAENERAIAVAQRSGRELLFFSARMRGGPVPAARRAIQAGTLGRIYRADVQFWLPASRACDTGKPVWFGQRAKAGGGAFMDMGQYLLDRTFHLLGWPAVQRVFAATYSGMPTGLSADSGWDVEDQVTLQAHLDGGCVLSCDATARVNQHWRWHTELRGTAATLLIDQTRSERKAVLQRRNGESIEEEELPSGPAQHNLVQRLQALAALNDGGPVAAVRALGTTPLEALQLTRFCELAYASAACGRDLAPEEAA
ncbi:MAG: Gfo/Idh/MocA family protein [Planctomycetota bacterium]